MAESLQAQTILEEVPPPRGPAAADGGMLPEIIPADIQFMPDGVEDVVTSRRDHQWRTYEESDGDALRIYVKKGEVRHADAVIEADKYDFATPDQIWKIWCKTTLDAAGAPTVAVIEDGVETPEDTATSVYRELAEIYNVLEDVGGPFLAGIRQLQFEPIRLGEGEAGASGDHMWKVTSSGPAGGVAPDTTYSVAGGIAVIQGTRVSVAAMPGLTASGGEGFVVLKVARVLASRVYDPGNIPVIEFYATVPPSTYAAEYTVLAETRTVTVPAVIPADPPTYRHDITQCRRDEICSYELSIVANGEFALIPVQANSRNSYAPPLP